MDISKILEVASQVLTVVVYVGGFCAVIFNHAISEWIKSRFAKAVGKELEEQKHQFSRDLETYKGSIVRDLEQFRANIDIKRSIALKTADARLEALRELAVELDRFCNECTSWPVLTPHLRQHNMEEFNNAGEASKKARRASEIFLPRELVHEISAATLAGRELVTEFPVNNETVLAHDDQRITKVMHKFVVVMQKVREQIHAAPPQLE